MVYEQNGNYRFIRDYLLESMAFKLRHAAEACGLLDKYESGQLMASDFEGKEFRVKVAIKKDKTGQYSDQNSIKDYVVVGKEPKNDNKDLDDSIPF
jgi:hypothetical protein